MLAIPFRDSGDGERQLILDALLPHIKSNYPFDWVELVDDSSRKAFSRASTRNLAVEKALLVGADVVVINDADSLCNQDVLSEAIYGASSDGKLHIPFDQVHMTNSGQLKRRPRRPKTFRSYHTYGPSCGGIYVIRPERWVLLGGQDERIVGWGYEDEILIVTSKNFIGGYISHPGPLYNFQHSRPDQHTPEEDENVRIRDKYHKLDGNPIGLRVYQYGSSRFV